MYDIIAFNAFAAHQYDFIGDNPGNTKVSSTPPFITADGTVDLFGWVGASSALDGVAAYGITSSKKDSDYGNKDNEALKNDWGSIAIGPYAAGTWRTPTGNVKGDWDTILKYREVTSSGLPAGTNSTAARYINAKVAETKGLIIFPDSYSHPSGVAATDNPVYNEESDYDKFVVDATGWEKMEAAGAVFLPAAGYRGGPVLAEGNDLEGSNARGYYWSSTGGSASNAHAFDLQFSTSNVSSASGDYRSRRLSVRLVRELD